MTEKLVVRFLDRTTPPHILTLVLIPGVAALSLNIFLPSLPSMAVHFGVPYPLMQLSVSLYLAATAVLQVVIGPISDRYGRRPVMLWAAVVFTLATLGAMVAPSFGVFLACRMVQAVVATGFALSRAVVRDMVPTDQAASMIGYVTMGMSIVPMIGPVLGGALDQVFGWQASFAILALGGAGIVALIWADLGETARTRSASFAEQARQYPELLRSPRFWGYCAASATASGAFFAYLGGAPYVGTVVYGMTPAELGLFFGAPAVGYLIGNFLSGRYSVRYGVNRMVLFGALTCTGGLGLLLGLDLVGISGPYLFFGLMICVGMGNGILLPNANAGMLSVRPQLAGSAAGLGGAITIGGGAALSALAGVVLRWGGGDLPLVVLMFVSSALSIPCILAVIRRARTIGAAP
ncbi:MAG TPA: multidrug effflux MFS transporter [Paracoccaceae bacterium]|nr:multidrug effflux MFS transporter [Paracoccaceae bacterium]